MKRFATIASGLKARHLAALLSLAAPSASLAQAFNNTDSVLNPAATTITAELNATGFFRISNITGLAGASVGAANISESPTATDFTATANYLSRLGSFTFANDYPIRNVSLSVSVDSIYDPDNGGIGGLSDDANTGQFDRTAFRIHDFSLLFVGSTGEQFLVSRNTAWDIIPGVPADDNFVVTVNSGNREPGLAYDADGTIPRTGQIQSLEWLSGSLPSDDGGWDTGLDPASNLDDTFPTTADIGTGAAQADDPTVTLERGFTTDQAPPLYAGGAGQTTWNVYLFSTGDLSGPTAGYQLNLSQIIIAVELPESSHALWGGLVLLGTAEVLRRRRSKRTT
jgi:hypothetical protein